MAIRFTIDGVEVECDNPQDAVAIIHALRGPKTEPQVAPSSAVRRQPPPRPGVGDFRAFFESIEPLAQNALVQISKHYPGVVDIETLCRELGVAQGPFGWARRRMTPLAQQHHIDLERLFRTEKRMVDGRMRTTYTPTERLVEELTKIAPEGHGAPQGQ